MDYKCYASCPAGTWLTQNNFCYPCSDNVAYCESKQVTIDSVVYFTEVALECSTGYFLYEN